MDVLEGLNDAQRKAVECIDGPSLIVAGAGSGKTRVLTRRIANVIGRGTSPDSVLALTFTNKAAREMKERIASLVGEKEAARIWMGTFHSVFIRFLRKYADRIGFPQSFTIYTTSDSKSAIKACIKELKLDNNEKYKPNEIYSRISKAKNNLITADAYERNSEIQIADRAAGKDRISDIFKLYSAKCKAAGAMDFDDILLYANILLRDNPDALEDLRTRFRYMLVDEYQDTNYAQYLIIKKLSSKYRNICVVGDDAQSIYGFRGARIENILNFKADYPEAKEFRLEQNYRSTKNIVNAANSLISKNSMQLKKNCFSAADEGEKIHIISAQDEKDEGLEIALSIRSRIYSSGSRYSDFAVFYRTNAQSRIIEESLRKAGIPYKIVNSFYDRAEVKDVLAYLRLAVNPKDDEAFKRVVNLPPKGIGETSMGHLQEAAAASGVSFYEAVLSSPLERFGLKAAAITKFRMFAETIRSLNGLTGDMNAYDFAMEACTRSGLIRHFSQDESIEGKARLENVEELLNGIKAFCEQGGNPAVQEYGEESQGSGDQDGKSRDPLSIESYLENVSLMTDMDREDSEEDKNKVVLMTVHSSKGLEFPYVYIAGMEDMLFPSVTSTSTQDEVEEERRLFYVALTRAEKAVCLSYAESRFKWGSRISCKPSRFIMEIDRRFRDELPENDFEDQSGIERGGFSGFSGLSGFSGGRRQPAYGGRPAGSQAGTTAGRQDMSRTSSANIPAGVRTVMHGRPANPDFKPDAPDKFFEGANVEHDRFGNGVILSLSGKMPDMRAVVSFDEFGEKTLLLKYAKLKLR